ncbi:MAG: hypothetical protein AAFQ13_03665 [Pseudomonadota bacterium]
MRALALAFRSSLTFTAYDDGGKTGDKHGIPPIPARMGPVGSGIWRIAGGDSICFVSEGDEADQEE